MFAFALTNAPSVLREAEANKLKLTPEFLELKFIDAIARNTKMFFGDKVLLISYFSFLFRFSAVLKYISLLFRYLTWYWIKGFLGTFSIIRQKTNLMMETWKWPRIHRTVVSVPSKQNFFFFFA